ncbi:hypothetical protein G7Y82_16460 [Solimonas sp. C16B3]|uniref:DUF6471 domain-containing protein n=2 Tax=Solimonas marina TaxID=2714601 RepID=A0A969WC96_9GAMM|nr:hypothetical protein [Solimonas marina]
MRRFQSFRAIPDVGHTHGQRQAGTFLPSQGHAGADGDRADLRRSAAELRGAQESAAPQRETCVARAIDLKPDHPRQRSPPHAMKEHREVIKRIIRVERARAGVTFDEISRALARAGISQSSSNLRAKASRGQMEAGLFLAVLDALGVRSIDIINVIPDLQRRPAMPQRSTDDAGQTPDQD